jgi:Domain of unknown function (DUF4157)
MTAPARNLARQPFGILQRKCACGGSEGSNSECAECKQKKLQRRAAGSGPETPPPIVHDVLRSPGMPLDRGTRAFMEPRFGHDFGNVRVHADARANESTRAVNALAYSVGQDVVFASGQYAPHTQSGLRLLAHELAHTVQNPEATGDLHCLRIGPADDPAERLADQAANAIMRNDRRSVAPAEGAVLRRQQRNCSADAPSADQPLQRNVRCSDGSVYRVTLTVTTGPASPSTRVTVNAGLNENEATLTIGICRGGTEVQLIPHVGDLSQAAAQALANVLAGSGALTGVTLSPGLRIVVIQKNSFTLSLDPTVQVGSSGATGGGVAVTVQTPKATVSVGATYSSPTHTGWLTFSITPGASQQSPNCPTTSRHMVFTCERVTHIPGKPAQLGLSMPESIVRNIFFHYPTANIRFDSSLNNDFQDLYDAGFRFKSITGFTSPEGPRGREHEPKFEGNIALGEERARSALNWLREIACPHCDFAGVTLSGRSELPPQLGALVPEPQGPGMERAAVGEFLGTTPGTTADPLAPKTPGELAAFRRLPQSQQRERAFELMRRATITMERQRIIRESKPAVPESDESSSVECAKDVTDAARPSFGITMWNLPTRP